MRKILTAVMALFLVSALLSAGLVHAKDDDKRRKPPTQKTEKISPQVFLKLDESQKALEVKDFELALSKLDELKATADKLNDYEKAQMYNFYAAIHYEKGDLDATIEDYKQVLKLEKIPDQLRSNALFRLAQLYFVKEVYKSAIKILDVWMASVESVSPDAHILKAQAHYQLDDYEATKKSALDALREASKRKQKPKENWLALLRAAYYELGDFASAAKLLKILIKEYPKPNYYKQLSGMYGLMDQQKQQLYVMHAAYVNGMLDSEAEILNMARLYMAEDASAPAIAVLQDAMEKGSVDPEKPDNLQLLGQAMALAQEYEAQIPVLDKLAKATGESKHYLYLGQAQIALNRWSDAADSLRKALTGKELDDKGNIQIQLGMALFNAGSLTQARRIFIDASLDEEVGDKASNWVKYVDSELQRKQAMQGG